MVGYIYQIPNPHNFYKNNKTLTKLFPMSSGTEEHLCDFCLSSPGVVKRGIIDLCLKHYNLTEGVRYEADEIVEKRKIEQCKCVQPHVF